MAPLNTSPSHSSTSTTPPSDTTLNEDIMNEIIPTPQPPKKVTSPSNHQSPPESQQKRAFKATPNFINTDYESSAAEDFDTYTLGKYENAESAYLSYSRTNKLDKLRSVLDAKAKGEITLDLNFKGHQKQNFSWTALHLACYFGHIEVVEILFSKKQFKEEIDINIQNNSGDTPLHKAVLTNRANIVQLLLSNGANVFLRNCDGFLASQLTTDRHIRDMLDAAEQVDRNRIRQDMFKAVDNGDLDRLKGFFDDYSLCIESVREVSSDDNDTTGTSRSANASRRSISEMEAGHIERISQMTDERGNTLLHVAAMRGFKAICVYLLEQGFDPYRKNQMNQSCIDLSSYQLKRLFTTVKPANAQLKKLTTQRVDRFEGPLLKKVRILGWRNIYAVLENGVILLFNNRRDSMNKSRRLYKYLESARCEPDQNDVGAFTVCFSDRSRATFLVSSQHLSSYSQSRLLASDSGDKTTNVANQIELVRQKWIDSLEDHIRYSTDFIRKGLKLNDSDEELRGGEGGDISTLDQLLPVDTIKSFVQEARAHYSILDRHAESLCGLVQSMNSSSELVQENWHCLLFHMRLLMESTQNTKESMGQALALMEHQEQLRQNRIQDQEERCRVLEDSLHALARDHHELEKSLSMSHLHRSAAARSMSVSTVNEYFDAFEDFDDDKTVTPHSMSSDEDLSQKIRDVMDEESIAVRRLRSDQLTRRSKSQRQEDDDDQDDDDDDDDDDDLRSNCSALTVETVSERSSCGFLQERSTTNLRFISNNNNNNNNHR